MIPLYLTAEKKVQVVDEAARWEKAGIISPEQATAVTTRYRPELVRVNLFIRILLALFTGLGLLALFMLLAIAGDFRMSGIRALLLLLAPLCAGVADRLLIRERRLYRCGAEEMLLYLSVLFLALGVGLDWDGMEQLGLFAGHLIVLAGATILATRYGYALAALAGVAALAALPVHLFDLFEWRDTGWARVALFLILGGLVVWAHRHLRQRDALPRGYVWCLETTRLAALVGIYLDVNFLAHHIFWTDWFGGRPPTESLSWPGWICAAFTLLIPLTALILGIWRRDRGLLWYGAGVTAASVFTLKYYFHFGYLAEEVTLGGLVLSGFSFGFLRWLRNSPDRCRGRVTAEPLLEPMLYDLDAEALAAMQPLAPQINAPAAEGFQPGGGRGGGGGASGGY